MVTIFGAKPYEIIYMFEYKILTSCLDSIVIKQLEVKQYFLLQMFSWLFLLLFSTNKLLSKAKSDQLKNIKLIKTSTFFHKLEEI